jgi:hypothetical protein
MFLPLNEKAEVRETTCKSFTRVRSLMISSVIPSQKYSWSGSGLMFSNGSTIMDFSWTGEPSDFRDDISGVISCFLRFKQIGLKKYPEIQ